MSYIDIADSLEHSSFRRLAIGAWGKPRDPKVYTKVKCEISAFLDLKASNLNYKSITITHFFTKVMGELVRTYPELNCVLIRNKLYYRKSVSAFIHTHVRTKKGYDLMGVTVENVDKLSVRDIGNVILDESKTIRAKKNEALTKSARLIKCIPLFAIKFFVGVLDFLFYTCNLKLIGMPKDMYGSYAITTVGGLGFEEAFVPLFPFSRLGLVLAVGKPFEEYVYDGKEHKKCHFVNLCFTMDHRFFDGAHFAKPLRLLKKLVKDPSLLKF